MTRPVIYNLVEWRNCYLLNRYSKVSKWIYYCGSVGGVIRTRECAWFNLLLRCGCLTSTSKDLLHCTRVCSKYVEPADVAEGGLVNEYADGAFSRREV